MPQKINIEQIAQLARLNLNAREKDKLSRDLESILTYVDQLQELNTQNIPPTSHVLPLANVYREDQVARSSVRDAVLEHAPKREGNFFKVPKVIEDK